MKEVSIIGVDLVLAKQVFQLHGATAEGEIVFRKNGLAPVHRTLRRLRFDLR